MSLVQIQFIDNAEQRLPAFATNGSCAVDLYSTEDKLILPYEWGTIATGIKIQMPNWMVGLICSRSGMASEKGVFVLNSPGVIDSDYRGEIRVILYNAGDTRYYVEKGQRIAQMMFLSHFRPEFQIVSELDKTQRGTNGFGSTGK
jgi:dUTP pyrophosphatase